MISATSHSIACSMWKPASTPCSAFPMRLILGQWDPNGSRSSPWHHGLCWLLLMLHRIFFHIFPCTSGKKNSTELGLVHVSFLFTTLPPPLKTIPNWSLLQVPSTNLTYKNQWQPIIYRSFPRETLKPWVFCKKNTWSPCCPTPQGDLRLLQLAFQLT